MLKRLLFASAAAILLPAAGPPADPAAAFGARERVLDISLSPSGDRIAFIASGPGQSTTLYTVKTDGTDTPHKSTTADGSPERLDSCGWVSEQRLVCTVYMVTEVDTHLVSATRIIAFDADGSKAKMLSRATRSDDAYVAFGGGHIIDWLPDEDGGVLMGRQYVPEAKIGTINVDKREGFGVDRINTETLQSKTVEAPKRNVAGFISDGHGQIRVMASGDVAGATGMHSGRTNYFYRAKGSREWQPMSSYNSLTQEGFYPVAVDPALDIAYGYRKTNGRDALYSFALDGSKRETVVFAHPQVDVDGTVRIGRANRVVGATYATDKREAVYFDPELKKLGSALRKAIPGLPLIRFVDSSVDENKLLLWAGSDTDPGRYFLFDKKTKQLGPLLSARPELEDVQLAAMRHVTYKAADGTMVPAYLTMPVGGAAKNLPAIVMPHGGPSARDEWGFDWLVQFYASRGYAVLQPNYRGSSGYGDGWFKNNGFQSWRAAIGDVNDAGRWLVSEGIADPSKLAIVGWSYGGYAALQSSVLDPNLYKAIVAVAPVTDFAAWADEWRAFTNFRVMNSYIGSGPHIREGSPAQNASKIKAPVLMFHGEHDRNVGIRQARMMHDRLKGAGGRSELVVYPRLDHQLDDTAARRDMLAKSDAFLRANLGIK